MAFAMRALVALFSGAAAATTTGQWLGAWRALDYPEAALLALSLLLLFGAFAALLNHLKLLVLFAWLSGLAFLLLLFGNALSTRFKSDVAGMWSLLVFSVAGFSLAVARVD